MLPSVVVGSLVSPYLPVARLLQLVEIFVERPYQLTSIVYFPCKGSGTHLSTQVYVYTR
jgi:hypothetical protein